MKFKKSVTAIILFSFVEFKSVAMESSLAKPFFFTQKSADGQDDNSDSIENLGKEWVEDLLKHKEIPLQEELKASIIAAAYDFNNELRKECAKELGFDLMVLKNLQNAQNKPVQQMINSFLILQRAAINSKDKQGFTVLMKAAQLRKIDLIKILINIPGIDVNLQNELGDTALHLAVKRGEVAQEEVEENRIEIIELLLNAPAIKIDIENEDGQKPINEAIKFSDSAVVSLLHSKKPKTAEEMEKAELIKEMLKNYKNSLIQPNAKQ